MIITLPPNIISRKSFVDVYGLRQTDVEATKSCFQENALEQNEWKSSTLKSTPSNGEIVTDSINGFVVSCLPVISVLLLNDTESSSKLEKVVHKCVFKLSCLAIKIITYLIPRSRDFFACAMIATITTKYDCRRRKKSSFSLFL